MPDSKTSGGGFFSYVIYRVLTLRFIRQGNQMWGLLVKMMFDQIKGQMAKKIELANKVRETVNK